MKRSRCIWDCRRCSGSVRPRPGLVLAVTSGAVLHVERFARCCVRPGRSVHERIGSRFQHFIDPVAQRIHLRAVDRVRRAHPHRRSPRSSARVPGSVDRRHLLRCEAAHSPTRVTRVPAPPLAIELGAALDRVALAGEHPARAVDRPRSPARQAQATAALRPAPARMRGSSYARRNIQ